MSDDSTQNVVSWVSRKLSQLRERSFYGKFVVELKEGRVTLLRIEETVRPPVSLAQGRST